jgi:putative oxidoreductase
MARPFSAPLAGVAADRGALLDSPMGARQSGARFLRAFVGGDARIRVLERYGALAARILISQIFILSGVMKVMDPAGTATQMEDRGMFWIHFLLWTAAAVEIGAGLCLLLGFTARIAALALFLFLIPVTLTFHNFWTYANPKERQDNMILMMHNLTLMGGLLLVMTFGPGPISLDHRKRAP